MTPSSSSSKNIDMSCPHPPTSSPSEAPRILDDIPVEVAIIGSGVCGVLAAATLRQKDGARVHVLEASPVGAGGIWRTTANDYSTLQVRLFLFSLTPSPPSLFRGADSLSWCLEGKQRRERKRS